MKRLLASPVALLFLFVFSGGVLAAQTQAEESGRPAWLRDIRRYEIVALGSFPFTMFFSTIAMDLHRWNRETGMDWARRQYAPWPIKASGAVAMTDDEQRATIFIAAGLSVTIALVDHFVVRSRRQRERRRAEAIPAGIVIITRTPLEAEPDYEAGIFGNGVFNGVFGNGFLGYGEGYDAAGNDAEP